MRQNPSLENNLAHPGKPDIGCRISKETLSAINAIAQQRNEGPTTTARSLWFAGLAAISATLVADEMAEDLKAIASYMPDFEDVPLGDEKFRFSVDQYDLDRCNAIAKRLNKKRSQIHRNAIAIGIWIDSRMKEIDKRLGI